MRHGNIAISWRRQGRLGSVLVLAAGLISDGVRGCPTTTKTVHEDERVVVTVQHEVEARSYTHPAQLTATDLASVLRGFSIREQQRLPLRWFAEEVPPKPLFREDEIQALAVPCGGTSTRGPGGRAHFEVRGPGNNPRYSRNVVGGWVAVRDPYLYLNVDYFHNQIPIRKSDNYDYNYPLTPPNPGIHPLFPNQAAFG